MGQLTVTRDSIVEACADEVSGWLARGQSALRLTPSRALVSLAGASGREGGIGSTVRLRMGIIPVKLQVDHRQTLLPIGAGKTHMSDSVSLSVPRLVSRGLVERRLGALLDFRHKRIQNDLANLSTREGGQVGSIAVTGSGGMIGSALALAFECAGHRVVRLVRRAPLGTNEIAWDPSGKWDAQGLEGIDAVVHLAGENIASGRWTRRRMGRIIDSRVSGTTSLCTALAGLRSPPKVLVSASGVGYYGCNPSGLCDESTPQGDGFLSRVAAQWEGATAGATCGGIRVVNMRLGLVVSASGGAVAAMRGAFQLGVGGRMGTGLQGVPWIHLDDVVYAIKWSMEHPWLSGPINFVAPERIAQRDFARSLASALHRPSAVPMPSQVVRCLLGQMGRELLLGGQFVAPSLLDSSGFRYCFPTLDEAFSFEFSLAR